MSVTTEMSMTAMLLRLYDAGKLRLDELVTTRYTLDQVNEGYQDLRDGKNIRGVIVYEAP
jgi:alcohol dehydrogenase (nicotinoprotein)